MISIDNSYYYIIINSFLELSSAKKNRLCRRIVYELRNVIYVWNRTVTGWQESLYVIAGDYKEFDYTVNGFQAYQKFYKYVGKNELSKMKQYYDRFDIFESIEQMHYANIEYAGQKLYKNIYVYDCNSSFTYGAMQLPKEFDKLKQYLLFLYKKKKNAKNKFERSTYKNLQNYLIGYFARVKGLIPVRSYIIQYSNLNIKAKMAEIVEAGGIVYLSNTDSIITDDIGNSIMQKYIGDDVGQFKLEGFSNRLFYKSPNCYQVGDKIKHSGVSYFSNKHTDYFKDRIATQRGSFIKAYDFILDSDDEDFERICKIKKDKIIVNVYDFMGDLIETYEYKLEV